MMKHWPLYTFIMIGCTTTSALAGSLEEIYRKALENDPQLRLAQATFRAESEQLPQARAGLLPSINAQANVSYTDAEKVSYNNHGYTVSLTQPVFSAAKWFTYQQGKVLDEQAQIHLDQAQQSLIMRTVEAYLNVLKAKSSLETAQAQERAIKRRLDQVNAQFDVGLIAITDVHEAQASYDNARVAMIEAEGALDNSFEALARLTGEDIIDVDVLSEDYPIQELNPAEPQPWLKKALTDNLSLRLTQTNIDVARKGARIARAARYPTLDLNATYDRDNGTATSSDWRDTKVVGLTLAVPLYQGGSLGSRSRQATARMEAAMEAHDDANRALKQSIHSVLRNLKTGVQSVSARKQSIVSSQAALDATSEGFNVGTRNVVDVLTAEQALYAAKRDYASARFSYVLSLFTLKQQVGSLSPEDLYGLDQWLVDN